MREKMLQTPVFTRLGWGSGNDADAKDDDFRRREPREQTAGPERQQAGGEPEFADMSEPATRTGDPASSETENHDRSASPERRSGGDSAGGSEETTGTGPEAPAVADATNQADEIAATPEDMIPDSDATDDLKSTEPGSDNELVEPRIVDEAGSVATSGADKEQRHRLDAAVDAESTVQGAGDAAPPDAEPPTALADGKAPTEGEKESEASLLVSNADASDGVQTGLEERQWTDPEKRRSWVEERLADPEHTKPVTSDKPWAQYQRARVGDVEVELQTAEPGSMIWADGLEIDPDTVVVVEVKYVSRPDRSLYEGNVPPRMLEMMLRPFDHEMYRYASVVQHNANPIERIRLVTSTDAAARFLGERARKILGEDIDLDIQVWSEEEH
ncbi:restriction endonuclease fold toxin-2 domain-containing protein [Kribbella sp. NPDC056345]|uniref:restriction endonuclease fold toxin-2 domain-containing protein n=1 Tax=Kribbella sp. NPDC056345 TaxID=3345789 RepID=UPI0035DF77E5